MEEYKLRPQAINDTRRYLKQWEDIVLKMNTTHPWITHKDRYTTMALVLKAQKWIETAVEAQNNLSLFENPILRVYEISSMLEVVGGNVTALKNLRPPKNYYEVNLNIYNIKKLFCNLEIFKTIL